MKARIFLAVLLSGLLVSSCNYFKKHRLFSKDIDTVLDMTIEEPEPVAEDTVDIYAGEEAYIEPEIEPEPVYSASSNKYFMIVGSFQNQNLARTYADKIQQMGYQSQVIEASNGYYRVSAKSYDNLQEGLNEISEFRSTLSAGAWVHIRY